MKRKLFIDTQILIWFYQDNPRLKGIIRDMIGSENNDVYVSQASLYEIAMKRATGRLPEFNLPLDDVIQQVEQNEFRLWSIGNHHLIAYQRIPYHSDHRDPVDRLLLATALAEQVAIISADEKFEKYADIIELIRA